MNEINGEKIDIIPWSEDPAEFIANSLLPARVLAVELNETEHIAHVEVAEDQLSLAIGKGGQNVRLAAKLTGWKIDIISDGATIAEATEEGVVTEDAPIVNETLEEEVDAVIEDLTVTEETAVEAVAEETPAEVSPEEVATEDTK